MGEQKIENIDSDEWQAREVFAKFGLAMYLAQCIEGGLVNLLVASRLKDKDKITRPEIDAFAEENYKKTLGGLIFFLKQSMKISENLESDLEESLEIRNYLAHSYFRVKAIDFEKTEGRKKMLGELELFIKKLQTMDSTIQT